ncbi:MAG: hypothetical protein KAR87_05070 [Candidatus Aenigmarchaeota archaeon]|nr:hypothetical protein [Candidatus Aenigmarchaeota archaeon]
MKCIFTLIIILILFPSFVFSLNQTNADNETLNQSLTISPLDISLSDLKIAYENDIVMITIFIENENEDYVTVSPDIVFKKKNSLSNIRMEETYEYILVPKKTTHVILKFKSNVFSDGIYDVELKLKAEEEMITEKEYILRVNGTYFILSDKTDDDEKNTSTSDSLFAKAGYFLDNYGIYLIAVLLIAFAGKYMKRLNYGRVKNIIPKNIKRTKMTSLPQRQEPVDVMQEPVPKKTRTDFSSNKARRQMHELDELKLKGWIDEKKYISLRKKILSVADVKGTMHVGAKNNEETPGRESGVKIDKPSNPETLGH